jgi:hypothetical protein
MPGPAATAAEHAPRRARYLIPQDTHRRGEIVAAIMAAVLVAHLVLAPLAIVLAAALYLIGRLTRWRALWLAVPAAAGLIWALATGPATAADGTAAGPRQVIAYLGGIGDHPSRLLHLASAFSGAGHWLPRQAPAALILAAAEAALWAWLTRLHSDETELAPSRPGLIVAACRWYTGAAIRAGGVVSRDGGQFGAAEDGRSAGVSWLEAEGGVLAAGRAVPLPAPGAATPGRGTPGRGSPGRGTPGRGMPGRGMPGRGMPGPFGPGPGATGFQLVHAAIRRRKPVIVVDLSGLDGLTAALAPVCKAAGAPLHQFGPAGRGFYDPLRGSDPARAAALVKGMTDWSFLTEPRRRACAAYLGDLFAVRGAAPIDPRQPALQDVLHLLDPAALRARLQQVPAHHPLRGALAGRVARSAALIEADPAGLPDIAGQLSRLQTSPAGRWLGQGGPQPGTQQLSLGRVLRERGACLFALDPAQNGPFAAMIARLVALDAMALCADLAAIPVSGDGLAWFNGCELLDRAVLAELVARGRRAGLAVVLSTTSDRAAASLAADVNVLAVHQLTDPAAARQLASLTGGPPLPAPPLPAPRPATPAPATPVPRPAGAAPGAGIAPAAVPQSVPAWALRMPASAVPPDLPSLPVRSDVPEPSFSSGPPVTRAPQLPSALGSDEVFPGAAAGWDTGPAADYPLQKNGSPAVTPESLLGQPGDGFALIVRGPARRVSLRCRAIAARLPEGPA